MRRLRGLPSDLAVFEALVILAMVLTASVAIAGNFTFGVGHGDAITRVEETVRAELIGDRCDLTPPQGTSRDELPFTGTCEAQLEVPSGDLAFTLLRVGEPLLALAVFYLLFRIVRTMRNGDPFVPANARRVTAIGLLVSVGGMLLAFVRSIATMDFLFKVHDAAGPGFIETSAEMSFAPAFIGLLILAFGEVFRQGTRLRKDVEGLV